MAVFLADIPRLPASTYADAHKCFFGPVARTARGQVTPAIVKEIEVDEALRQVQSERQKVVDGSG